MKKFHLFQIALLILIGNIANASVEEKTVELHITRPAVEDTLPAKKRVKVPYQEVQDRHYVCSGGFISPVGFILTARHCTEGASSIEIVTFDQQHYIAEIVAVSIRQDLALLHIDRIGTPYFVLASSVAKGEDVSTVGSPLALTSTQSWGRIARKDGDLLFLDQSILPGNSGGIVFNQKEELVGVAVSVAIVGMGVTHLAQAQSLDSIRYFLMKIFQWRVQP